jgi:dephospho-CoA kinase
LTGGIASGKSTVARLLAERGAVIIDADELARDVVEPGTPAWSKIVEHFGSAVVLPDKRIDRPALGEIVFNDPARLALLNEIVHPEVMRRIADRIEELSSTDAIVVADVPLLVEVGATSMFNVVVVVNASERAQVDRMRRVRGMDEDAARARIAAQLPTAEKADVADWVVTNDGSLEELEASISALWEFLEARRGGRTAPPD